MIRSPSRNGVHRAILRLTPAGRTAFGVSSAGTTGAEVRSMGGDSDGGTGGPPRDSAVSAPFPPAADNVTPFAPRAVAHGARGSGLLGLPGGLSAPAAEGDAALPRFLGAERAGHLAVLRFQVGEREDAQAFDPSRILHIQGGTGTTRSPSGAESKPFEVTLVSLRPDGGVLNIAVHMPTGRMLEELRALGFLGGTAPSADGA